MKLPIAMLALAAGFAPAGATDLVRVAQADPDDLMPPYELMTLVRSPGLTPTARPSRRGDLYVVPAVDGNGTKLRVVVDGEVGDILAVRPVALEAAAPPRVVRPAYRTWLPPDPYESVRGHPVPPRSVPQIQRAPATLTPPRPPVPRLRPSAAPPSVRAAAAGAVPAVASPEPPAAIPPVASPPTDPSAMVPVAPLE